MATEKRLIDANVLDDAVQVSQHCNPHEDQRDRAMHNHEHLHFRVLISQSPTVDAVEVVHGHWKATGDHFLPYQCSACESLEEGRTNYCPNCGAKMDGGVDRGL